MPKHLYTIEHGTALPDPTTVPDGYPFLLETGSGATLKRAFYQNQGGTWKQAGGGGGGGSVQYGHMLPATGAPIGWAIPGTAVGMSDPGGPVVTTTVSDGNISSDNIARDPNGNAVTQAWKMGAPGSDAQDNWIFRVSVPNDPGSADRPGRRAMRMDFRLLGPGDYSSRNDLVLTLLSNAYDPADVGRVIPGYSAVWDAEAHAPGATRNYWMEDWEDPSNYCAIWAARGFGNSWGSYSVIVPPGASNVYFSAWTPKRYSNSNSSDYTCLITDVRFTPCDDAEANGSVFVEMPTGKIFVYDASDLLPHTGSTDTPAGGAGWYQVTRGHQMTSNGNDIPLDASEDSMFHAGFHYFSALYDFDGNEFAQKSFAKLGIEAHVTLPTTANLPRYDDYFVRGGTPPNNGSWTNSQEALVSSTMGTLPAPSLTAATPQFAQVHHAGTYFYVVAGRQYVTGQLTVISNEVSTTLSDFQHSTLQVPATDANGVGLDEYFDALYLFRSTTSGSGYVQVGRYGLAVNRAAQNLYDYDKLITSTIFGGSSYVFQLYDDFDVTPGAAAPSADGGTVDVTVDNSMLNFFGNGRHVSVDTGHTDGSTTFAFTSWASFDIDVMPALGTNSVYFTFRAEAVAGANCFAYRCSYDAANSRYNWALVNRVASADTVLASGTWTDTNSAGIASVTVTWTGSASTFTLVDGYGTSYALHSASVLTGAHSTATLAGVIGFRGLHLARFKSQYLADILFNSGAAKVYIPFSRSGISEAGMTIPAGYGHADAGGLKGVAVHAKPRIQQQQPWFVFRGISNFGSKGLRTLANPSFVMNINGRATASENFHGDDPSFVEGDILYGYAFIPQPWNYAQTVPAELFITTIFGG